MAMLYVTDLKLPFSNSRGKHKHVKNSRKISIIKPNLNKTEMPMIR